MISLKSEKETEERPDLTRRFQMQVYFPDVEGQDESWDTINSFATPLGALRGCSECLETVKMLLEIPYGTDLTRDYFRIRVWDSEDCELLLWEDEDGSLHGDSPVFESGLH